MAEGGLDERVMLGCRVAPSLTRTRGTAMTKKRKRDAPAKTLRAYLKGPPKVSQRELARALGVHQSMVSMLAKGKRAPSATLLKQLHAITGVPLASLLHLADEPPPRHRRRRRRPPPEDSSRRLTSSHI